MTWDLSGTTQCLQLHLVLGWLGCSEHVECNADINHLAGIEEIPNRPADNAYMNANQGIRKLWG